MLGGKSMMSLASQLVSIGYLMLLGVIWGFVWELLEELLADSKKSLVLLIVFMLPISGIIWYISNNGALRYYVPVAVVLGILIFSLLSKRTVGSTLALGVKRILGSIGLIFTIVWFFLHIGVESLGVILYAIGRRFKRSVGKKANTVPKYN